VVANELEILGSHGMQAFKYPEVFDLIKTGKIDLKKFIKKTISLKEAITALPKMDAFEHNGVQVITNFN
ncbi:MAG: alcohol dehydrogenase, partial [Eudoraea sp.]|nr:alcohol dehydrogenase [Eudoraea sp.]